MWELLRRFNALESEARGLLVRAAVLLPVISLCLRIRGFRFAQGVLHKLSPATEKPAQSGSLASAQSADSAIAAKVLLTARMVRAAARYSLVRATCLEQSLTLWFLLRRQGMAAELRIGARKVAGKFEAHAWVECDGEALDQAKDVHRHYAAFDQALSAVMEAP